MMFRTLLSKEWFLAALILQLLSQVIFTVPSAACGPDGGGFLPENDMRIPVSPPGALTVGGITEDQFNSVLNKVSSYYASIVRSKGGNLSIERRWTDSTVNAYADRSGTTWWVRMYGGLARHPAISEDGFALVACHELGHHLGGVPRYSGQWAANEGQSDYFATLKCLRRIWQNDDNVQAVLGQTLPPSVVSNCEKSYADAAGIALCKRIALAGYSSALLSKALDHSPTVDFDQPDPSVVQSTSDPHPRAQCRLDTYYQGTLCQVRFDEEIGQNDPTVGTCSTEKGATFGARPFCWYKPQSGGPNPNPIPNPNPGPTPVPQPGPGGSTPSPTVSGQTDVMRNNPYQPVVIEYDVSMIPGATGIYFEFTQPNRTFLEPNGINPDPMRTVFAAQAGARGQVMVFPIQQLPGWGTYQFRVIPLGGSGTFPVGVFSNASVLRLLPQRLW